MIALVDTAQASDRPLWRVVRVRNFNPDGSIDQQSSRANALYAFEHVPHSKKLVQYIDKHGPSTYFHWSYYMAKRWNLWFDPDTPQTLIEYIMAHTPFFYTLHKEAGWPWPLNGNNGSATNTDDTANDCKDVLTEAAPREVPWAGDCVIAVSVPHFTLPSPATLSGSTLVPLVSWLLPSGTVAGDFADTEWDVHVTSPTTIIHGGGSVFSSVTLGLCTYPFASDLHIVAPVGVAGTTLTQAGNLVMEHDEGRRNTYVELTSVSLVPNATLRTAASSFVPRLRFSATGAPYSLYLVYRCPIAETYPSFGVQGGSFYLRLVRPSSASVVVSNFPAVQTVSVNNFPAPTSLTNVNIQSVSPTSTPLWISDMRTPPLPGSDGYAEYLQRTASSRAHALHGNTTLALSSFTTDSDTFGDDGVPAAYSDSVPAVYDDCPFFPVDLDATLLDVAIADHKLDDDRANILRFVFGVELPLTNSFDGLEIDDDDMPDGSARVVLDSVAPVVAIRTPAVNPEAAGRRGLKNDKPVPARVAAELKVPDMAHLAEQRVSVLDRICARLRAQKTGMASWLMHRRPNTEWAIAVAARFWGKGWAPVTLDQQATSVWLLYTTDYDRRIWIAKFMMSDVRIQYIVTNTLCLPIAAHCNAWFNSAKVLPAEADAHNAKMHAIHGNTVITTMDDVLASPTLDSYTADEKVEDRFNGRAAALAISMLPSDTNPTDANVAVQSLLRAQSQAPNGIITSGVIMEPLETTMAPRMECAVPPALVPATSGTRWTRFVSMGVAGLPTVPTRLWTTLGVDALQDKFQMGRNDTLAPNGFKQWDVLNLGQLAVPNGFEMSAPLLKLKLWHKILSWKNTNTTFLPTSNDLSRFDPGMNGSNLVGGGIAVNTPDPTGFGEALGGAAAHYPFDGGSAGTVTFHICLDTVPMDHRCNLVVFPKCMLRALGDLGKEYAVFVGMLIKWPFLWYSVMRSTRNGGLGPYTMEKCAPHALTTYVDGILDIHVLLPRTGSGLNPTSQAAATACLIQAPWTGPLASAALGATQMLNVAWMGGPGPFSVPACEYMYTWSTAIGPEDIRVFIMCMYRVADLSAFINMADERVAMCAVRYSPMVTTPNAVRNFYSSVQILPDGRCLSEVPGIFPQDVPPESGFIIPEFDNIAWNHLALGTRVCEGAPPSDPKASPMLSQAQNVYWMTLQARRIAITRHMLLSTTRLTADTWNAAFRNGLNHEMRDYVRGFYCNGTFSTVPTGSENGPLLEAIHKHTHHEALFHDQFGLSVYSYMLRPYQSYATIHNGLAGGLAAVQDRFVPVFLPDAWMWGTLPVVPRCLAPYPPNWGNKGTTGIVTDDMRIVQIGQRRAPHVRMSNTTDRIFENELPEWNDAELWNLGLWIEWAQNTGAAIVTSYRDGTVHPTFAAAHIYCPTVAFPDPSSAGFVRAAGTVLDGTRMSLPLVEDDGTSIFYSVTNVVSIQLSNIMTAREKAMMNVWLFNNVVPVDALKVSNGAGGMSKQRLAAQAARAKMKTDPPGDLPLLAGVSLEALAMRVAEPAIQAGGRALQALGATLAGDNATVQATGVAPNTS
jgi:hypothetical protein